MEILRLKLKYLQISISILEEPKRKSNPTPHISDEETTIPEMLHVLFKMRKSVSGRKYIGPEHWS